MTDEESQLKVQQIILQNVPKEAEISRIEYEGPRLAIYSKKPEVLIDQSYIVTDIVNLIRKRITIRSDPSVRMNEKEAEQTVRKLIPTESEVTNIMFDHTLGEVIIEAKKPGLVICKDGSLIQEIIKETKWRPQVLRSPPLPSKIIAHVRHYLYTEVKERERILRSVGERVFRPKFLKDQETLLTFLGGCQQVGRSSFLLRTKESNLLIDCGINPASSDPKNYFPRFDVNEFDIDNLDAVAISHAHLDHCGALPLLYKYGYDGPVYCSEPTLSLMILLQLDYLDVSKREGVTPPYDQKDVREVVTHAIPVRYGVVTDVTPDMKLTLHNAGHILGSSILHLHVGEGLHNVVYTGDFKFMHTTLFEAATVSFPRVETLITESTYGAQNDIMPTKAEVELKLTTIVNETLNKGGKVLIPVLAVGRAQEVMLVLSDCMRKGLIQEVPIFLEGMINEVTAIHTAYPEYLSKELQNKILHEDINPFQFDYFMPIKHPETRRDVIEGKPCIILATSGMLEGGPVLDYLKHLATDEKNTMIIVSYQFEGTLGRRLQSGIRDISLTNSNGKMEAFNVKMRIEFIEGFSGHSDRNQLLAFIRRMSPKPNKVFVCHGEKSKCLNLASLIRRVYKVKAESPAILETVRLC
ncbi:MAG: beta-CASP ribonuclease aCPSF1 [Candidatus Bathyarchaeota archaeon]